MKTALICIAKNEDAYIDEWIKYHTKLGFDDIYVYQNDWRYKGDKSQYNNVRWIEFDGKAKQLESYQNFIKYHNEEYDRAAFFDVDEYLVLRYHNNLKDWLNEFNDYFAVGVNWKFFGDNGISEVISYKLINRFISAEKNLNQHIKSILNLKKCRENNIINQIKFREPHSFVQSITNDFTISTNKQAFIHGPFNHNTENYTAQLNHYYCKTFCEYVNFKRPRGYADQVTTRCYGNDSFIGGNINETIDLLAYNFYNNITQKTIDNNYAICIITDGNNLNHCNFLIKQITLSCKVKIFVLTNKKNLNIIKTDNVFIIDISDIENKYCKNRKNTDSTLPNIVMAKLYIPILQELNCFEKVLYLDTDLQLLDNWYNIFNETSNSSIKVMKEDEDAQNFWSKSIFDRSGRVCKEYSNTGVILFFLKKFNKQEYLENLEKMIDLDFNSKFLLRDQDIINIYFDKDTALDKNYNTFSYKKNNESKILHYTASLTAKQELNKLISLYIY